MIKKDLHTYAIENWNAYLQPISKLSKSGKGVSLVPSSVELYNFDDICKSLFAQGKAPTSADGLGFSGRTVELIEFKSGFKQRITKYNLDPEKAKCPEPNVNKICDDYWDLFFKNQKTNISVLISSIRYKAIESYVTLEKQVFPRCQNIDTPILLKIVVVIDEDEIDSIEDIYSELAGETTVRDNHFSSIRSALSRLINQRDIDGNSYFYDCVEVLSVQDYLNKLKFMG